jgi:dolichol-phosphate mannosyltransferase
MKNSLVIIPTYNEIENVNTILDAVMAVDANLHVLVVEDNSPDGTADAVKRKITEYPNRISILERKGKLGLGTAYIAGFKYGIEKNYEYIIEMDADFSHNPNDLPKLYASCAENGNHLAVGSRYKNGVNVVNWSMKRVLMSYFASKYVKFITGMPLHDATAGFVCYRTELLKAMDLEAIKFVGYAFQIEMKFTTWIMNGKIEEVPIIFTDRTKGESKMSTKIFKEAFFGVISMKISTLFKKPAFRF